MSGKNTFLNLKSKIESKKASVAVIGLGYVGLPLALEFVKAGFDVVGVDNDKNKVDLLKNSKTYITDITTEEIRIAVATKRFTPTTDYKYLKKCSAIIICVPTPLRKTKEPDISYIVDASKQILKYITPEKLVVLESTTYPGTTEEVLVPLLAKSKLKPDKDFFAAFSPERVDPGNSKYKTCNIPKVVGGISDKSTELAVTLYGQIIKNVIPVSSSQTAEMVKMYENTFRSVNIALANELALVCSNFGINVWEVISAASSKPFGFMPFYPGPGIGGHCIPLDPLYLAWKAKLHGFETKFIDLASEINSSMPEYVVQRLVKLLKKKPIDKSRIFIIGVAYKRDVSDVRESPAIEIIKLLEENGADVVFYDPYVSSIKIDEKMLKCTPLTEESIKKTDCALIVTDHSSIDYDFLVKFSKLIFDTRNVLGNYKNKNITRL